MIKLLKTIINFLPKGKTKHKSKIKLKMATGTVKWFNPTKGFGFIQPDDGGEDLFVHMSKLEEKGIANLNEDQKVSFDTEEGRNGKIAATNIALID